MAGSSVAIPTEQDNSNPAFDKVWIELGFTVQTPSVVERDTDDEIEEHAATEWQDFLSYHAGVLR